MENLEKAFAILDGIDPSDDRDVIKKKALEAYESSSKCLDALVLLARLENSYLRKISLLEEGLTKEDLGGYSLPLDDSFLSRQLLRYLKEMLDLYLGYGDLVKAYELVKKMTRLKKEDVYMIYEDKLILSVYFDDPKTYQALQQCELDPFVKDLAAYVYLLEHGLAYQEVLQRLIAVYHLDEKLALDDEEDKNRDDKLRYLLARYSFLLNRSYLTLRLILKGGSYA